MARDWKPIFDGIRKVLNERAEEHALDAAERTMGKGNRLDAFADDCEGGWNMHMRRGRFYADVYTTNLEHKALKTFFAPRKCSLSTLLGYTFTAHLEMKQSEMPDYLKELQAPAKKVRIKTLDF